jgi:hypothetical protein
MILHVASSARNCYTFLAFAGAGIVHFASPWLVSTVFFGAPDTCSSESARIVILVSRRSL